MIKNILFDLDDTIFDFKKSEAVAISNTLSELGAVPSAFIIKRYSEINDSMWKQLEKGTLTREQILVMRFAVLFEEFGIQANPAETRKIYEKHLSSGHFFIDGALDVIKKLYKKYNLYIVSNGTATVQKGRLESSGIEKYFKKIFISQNIGYNKPDIRFFKKVFEQIENFRSDEIIIVGDSLTSDIQGGINAGIKTVWYCPNGSPDTSPADFVIRNLDEIFNIV